jgi:hypothetical protein
MKDFSATPRVVEFKIDQDVFRGKPFLAAQTMIDFTLKVDSLGDEEDVSAQQGFDTMAESLQLVLMPDSYSRLRARMREPGGSTEQPDDVLGRVRETVLQAINGGSQVIPTMVLTEALEPRGDGSPTENDELNPPIELPKVNEILEWLMGEYGMRPPTSAEGSSDGSSNPASGTNSTESVSREVSISSLSLPTSS